MSDSSATRDWTGTVVIPALLAAVVIGLLLLVFTPVGAPAREIVFPTKAAVTGVIELDGSPLPRAAVHVDGKPVQVTTDGTGRFQLPDVGDGRHKLRIEAEGTLAREYEFDVETGADSADLGVIAVDAQVTLGYLADVRIPDEPSARTRIRYDVTLWMTGADSAMRQVRRVSYVLPAPLPADLVTGGDPADAFCYRVKGTLAYGDLSVLGGKFTTALATVELTGGGSFLATATPAADKPVKCAARKGSELKDEVDREQLSNQTNPINPTSPAQVVKPIVPDVTGLTERDAVSRLIAQRFRPEPRFQPSDSVRAGTVIGTDPAAGTRSERGARVTVLVSAGPAPEEPPSAPPSTSPSPESGETKIEPSGGAGGSAQPSPGESKLEAGGSGQPIPKTSGSAQPELKIGAADQSSPGVTSPVS